MLEKRRNVIRGLAVAGMRRTGTAAKRPTLTHRSIASVPHGTKGVLARRDRRRASCAIRAAHRWHCTDARHGTVRTHPLQVCLAAADKAPIGFAHGRHRSRAGASAACAAGMDSPCKGIFSGPGWRYGLGPARSGGRGGCGRQNHEETRSGGDTVVRTRLARAGPAGSGRSFPGRCGDGRKHASIPGTPRRQGVVQSGKTRRGAVRRTARRRRRRALCQERRCGVDKSRDNNRLQRITDAAGRVCPVPIDAR